MGLGKVRKLFKGGLLRKIGKFIGKVDARLQKVRRFIFRLKLAQINRIATSTEVVASQVEYLGGASSGVSYVAGGIGSIAGEAADLAAKANGFLTSADEELFKLGRSLYKRCYRILRLCADVLGIISKFAKKLRKVVKIVRTALKIGKWVSKLLGASKLSKLIAKAERFLEKVQAALLIVQRSTGQLAAICRDLSDQLLQMKEKYQITADDLSVLDSDGKIDCEPDLRYPSDRSLDFCDPDWDDEIDDTATVEADLEAFDNELDDLELEIQAILDKRAPQTKNECLRFLADLDCIDRLEAIVGGLDDLNSSVSEAQTIINRAKNNIDSSKTNIANSVGILDFNNQADSPVDAAANKPIIESISGTRAATVSIQNLKEVNLNSISKNGPAGIEYNDNKIPEYLNHREHIDNEELEKLTGPEFISRYKQGISLRTAMEYDTVEDLLVDSRIGPEIYYDTPIDFYKI